MIADILKGLLKYVEALSFIFRIGLGRYFLYSGLIGLAVMAVAGVSVYTLFPMLSSFLAEILPDAWNISWLTNATDVISFLGGSVFFIFVFKYLMLIFTAPLMSKLSEVVEIHLSGDTQREKSVYNFIKEILRGARIALRNIIRELGLTILILLIGLLPVVGVVAAPLLLLVQAFYAGFGNLDFWAERHYDYRNTIKYMSYNRGVCIGNGIPYVFMLAIPILGVFLAPPLATIAGTLHAESKREF